MSGTRLFLVTALPEAGGGIATAACLALALAEDVRLERPDDDVSATLLLDGSSAQRRRPTLLASAPARRMERVVGESGMARAAARGSLCWVTPSAETEGPATAALMRLDGPFDLVAYLPPQGWRQMLEDRDSPPDGVLVRADRGRHAHVCALLAAELRGRRVRHAIATRAPGMVASRRALAGIAPGGDAAYRAMRAARRLAGPRRRNRSGGEPGRAAADATPRARPLMGESGQALPLVLGASLIVIALALIAVAIGAATTGAGRVQRAADLGAVAAARSMRDDRARLFEPAALPDGSPNPRAMSSAEYLERARAAAIEVSRRAGIAARRLHIVFPSSAGAAPTRVTVSVRADLPLPDLPGGGRRGQPDLEVEAKATAEAVFPASAGATDNRDGRARGDYSGPLAYRQGKPMRPDVAQAFDRLAAAASGRRSRADDHLRLPLRRRTGGAVRRTPRSARGSRRRGSRFTAVGPSSTSGRRRAYAWLAANAPRFGFVQRYAWEAWHYGYTRARHRARRPRARSPSVTAIAPVGIRGPAVIRPRPVPQRDRRRVEPLERPSRPVGRAADGRVGLRPWSGVTGRGAGHRPVHSPDRRRLRATDPFDAEAVDPGPSAADGGEPAPFGSTELALAAYNAGPARSRPATACRRIPRPRPT